MEARIAEHIALERLILLNHRVAAADVRCVRFSCETPRHTSQCGHCLTCSPPQVLSELRINFRNRESRNLKTPELDFANILAYASAQFSGVFVLHLSHQAHTTVETG
ncbi:MAG TPA: hypothetical protein VK727_08180 [Steroidobacteraceae bacterium]|jgi:hypothetical protein|nr:hypothetical protein [Steroidobacteraceae bacterium]